MTLWPRNYKHSPKKDDSSYSQKYELKIVHRSFIRKHKKLEINLVLINRRMDKQIDVLQQGLQLSNKKGLTTNKHNYMNKFQKHYL